MKGWHCFKNYVSWCVKSNLLCTVCNVSKVMCLLKDMLDYNSNTLVSSHICPHLLKNGFETFGSGSSDCYYRGAFGTRNIDFVFSRFNLQKLRETCKFKLFKEI